MYVINANSLNDEVPELIGNETAYSLNDCGCNRSLMGLNDLTDDEVGKIVEDHFKNLPTTKLVQIGYEIPTGKTTAIAQEVRIVAEKVCTAGAKARAIDTLTSPYGLVALGVGTLLLANAIFGK